MEPPPLVLLLLLLLLLLSSLWGGGGSVVKVVVEGSVFGLGIVLLLLLFLLAGWLVGLASCCQCQCCLPYFFTGFRGVVVDGLFGGVASPR